MKRLVLVALLCVLLGAVAFAETEDEARAALQNTLIELEETYGAELLPEEQLPKTSGNARTPKSFRSCSIRTTWASTRPKKG